LAKRRQAFGVGIGRYGGERFIGDLAAEGFGLGALDRGPVGRWVVAQV